MMLSAVHMAVSPAVSCQDTTRPAPPSRPRAQCPILPEFHWSKHRPRREKGYAHEISIRAWIANRWTGVLLLLASFAAFAPRLAAADITKGETIEGITEYRLDNGLQVLLFPDDSKPTVTVNLTVFVGSRQEGYGETGMAHLLEHMLFKGTPDHPHIPKVLQERGARFNGTTWVDRTNYYETLPALQTTIWSLPCVWKPTGWSTATSSSEDLMSEMTVVRNEFEQRREFAVAVAQPANHVGRLRLAQLRQVDHRQPQRYRAGADPQLTGLLSQVLPA